MANGQWKYANQITKTRKIEKQTNKICGAKQCKFCFCCVYLLKLVKGQAKLFEIVMIHTRFVYERTNTAKKPTYATQFDICICFPVVSFDMNNQRTDYFKWSGGKNTISDRDNNSRLDIIHQKGKQLIKIFLFS